MQRKFEKFGVASALVQTNCLPFYASKLIRKSDLAKNSMPSAAWYLCQLLDTLQQMIETAQY